MNARRRYLFLMGVLLLALLAASPLVQAAMDGLSLDWWTVDGGGGGSTGGAYSLQGSLGQPDAGALSGGDYALAGGFWSEIASAPPSWRLNLPEVMR